MANATDRGRSGGRGRGRGTVRGRGGSTRGPGSPGWLDTEVFQKMTASDLFLLPSLEEGIANVAVEAMALGTPVVTTNCGGMEELISHDQEGWIVPTRNTEAIAEQLINFTTFSVEKVRSIKKSALQKVEAQHNEKKMVEGMLELYSRIIV